MEVHISDGDYFLQLSSVTYFKHWIDDDKLRIRYNRPDISVTQDLNFSLPALVQTWFILGPDRYIERVIRYSKKCDVSSCATREIEK